uniref:Uncharacterized protein n=1 Tax=Arundo donax TaxID=35708 RepID=A0A0A9F235_ARUDO
MRQMLREWMLVLMSMTFHMMCFGSTLSIQMASGILHGTVQPSQTQWKCSER